jgi:hypothetical protein
MSYFPGLAGLAQTLGDLNASGQIEIDRTEIDALKTELQKTAADLKGDGFDRVRLTESAFGGSETAAELGHHHGLAHTIVADTIAGVVQDLDAFRVGVAQFDELVGDADNGAAVDLSRQQEAVEALVSASSHSHGDQKNHESRSENLPLTEEGDH